tara:strand:- start:1376 stop:2089 length:714 start_codon:yes stop_codon:yes gene_type:complete
MDKSAIVIGNGRSLKGFDFKTINRDKYETVGCGFAFRHWDKIDWWPDMWVCIDHVVLTKNIDEIKEFILKKKCRVYIVSAVIKEVWPDIPEDGCIIFFEQLKLHPVSMISLTNEFCSGSIASLCACDGFTDVRLIGFDCDYVEMIPECQEQEDGSLKIMKTPEYNPNYFFDDYQREGDYYNKPNTKKIHNRSWEEFSFIIEFINKMYPEDKRIVKNYNDKTSISDYVETMPLASLFN